MQLPGVGEQSEEFVDPLLRRDRIGRVGVVELLAELVAFEVQVLESLREFLGRPARLSEKVQALVFEIVELRQLGFQPLPDCFSSRLSGTDRLAQELLDVGPLGRGDRDGREMVFDCGFDRGVGEPRNVAGTRLSACAAPIEVDAAGVALGGFEDETLPAAVAPETAFEEVVPDPFTGAAAARGEDALNAIEQDRIDERLVTPAVLLLAPNHVPEVVAIAEDLLELADRYRCPGRAGLGRTVSQSRVGQRLAQLPEPVLAGGEEFESGFDERSPLGVEFDGGDVAAVELLADVEVAEFGATRSAAAGRLRSHLEGHVRAELARVVLVDAVEDERHQVALRAGLGRLLRR